MRQGVTAVEIATKSNHHAIKYHNLDTL